MTLPLDETDPVLNDRAVIAALLQSFCADVPDDVRFRLLHTEVDMLQHIFAIRPRLSSFGHRRTTSMRHPSMSMAVRQYFISYRAARHEIEEQRRLHDLQTAAAASSGIGGGVLTRHGSFSNRISALLPKPITSSLLAMNNWALLEYSHARITRSSTTVSCVARLVATDKLVNDAILRFWDRITVGPTPTDPAGSSVPQEAKSPLSCSTSLLDNAPHALVMSSMQYVYLHLRIANVLLPQDTLTLEMLDAIATDLRTDAGLHNEATSFGLAPQRAGMVPSFEKKLMNPRTSAENMEALCGFSLAEVTYGTIDEGDSINQSRNNFSFGSLVMPGENTEPAAKIQDSTGALNESARRAKKGEDDKKATGAAAPGPLSGRMNSANTGVALSMLPDLNYAQFWQSMLELADNWTSSSHPSEYLIFLTELYCEVFAHDWDEEDEAFKKALRAAMDRRNVGDRWRRQKATTLPMPEEDKSLITDVMKAFNDMGWSTVDSLSSSSIIEVKSTMNFEKEDMGASGGHSIRGHHRRRENSKHIWRGEPASLVSRESASPHIEDSKGSHSSRRDEEGESHSSSWSSFADGEQGADGRRHGAVSRGHHSSLSGKASSHRHRGRLGADDSGSSILSLSEGPRDGDGRRPSRPHRRGSKHRHYRYTDADGLQHSVDSLGGDDDGKRRRRRKSSSSWSRREWEKGEGPGGSLRDSHKHYTHSARHRRRSRRRASGDSASSLSYDSLLSSSVLSDSLPSLLASVVYSVPDEVLTPLSRERRLAERADLNRRREEYYNRLHHHRERDGERYGERDGERYGERYHQGDRDESRDRDRRRRRERRRERRRRRREREGKGMDERPPLVGHELIEKRRRVMEMLRLKGINLHDDFFSDEDLQRICDDGAVDPALLEQIMRSAAELAPETLSELDFLHILLGDGDAKPGDVDAATAQSIFAALRNRRDATRLETQAERHKRKLLEKKLREEQRAAQRAEREAALAAAQALASAKGEESPRAEKEGDRAKGKVDSPTKGEKPLRRALKPRPLSALLDSASSTDSLPGLWVPRPPGLQTDGGAGMTQTVPLHGVNGRPRLPTHSASSQRPSDWKLCVEPHEAVPLTDVHEFSPSRLALFYSKMPKNKPYHGRAPLVPLSSISGGTYHQLPSISVRYGGMMEVRAPPTMANAPHRCAPVKLFSLTKKRTLTAAIKESLNRYVEDKTFLETMQKSHTMN